MGDLPSCDHAATCSSSSSSFMVGMDQKGRCSGMYKAGFVGHYAPRAVFFPGLQAPSARHYGRYGPEGQLPEAYRLLVFLGDDSAWFDRGYIQCVSLRGFWKYFGVVQTVQKTVKVPHCSWTWLLTSAGWLRQCRYCGVSAVGAALLCLC